MKLLNHLELKRLDHMAFAVCATFIFMLVITNTITMFFGSNMFSPATLWFLSNGFLFFRAARYYHLDLTVKESVRFHSFTSLVFVIVNGLLIVFIRKEKLPENLLVSFFMMYIAAMVVALIASTIFSYVESIGAKKREKSKMNNKPTQRKNKKRRLKRSKKSSIRK